MSFGSSAGVIFSLSAGVPGSFTAGGYAGLSWTPVGEVTNYSEIGGEWGNENHNPAAKSGTQKMKTVWDPGSFTLTMALDTDDAGQVLMKQARASRNLYAARFQDPNGDVYYCQVLVNNFKVTLPPNGGKKTASAACAVTTSSTDVDWVEALA